MVELMDPDEGDEDGEGGGKKSTLVVTIFGVLIASVIAAGGGWFLGGMLAPQSLEMQKAAEVIDHVEKQNGKGEEWPNLIRSHPITTNLAFPSESWVRLEVSLVVKGEPDIEMVELIHQEILGYMQTLGNAAAINKNYTNLLMFMLE